MPDPDCGESKLDPLICPICGEPSQEIRRALTASGAYRCIDCLLRTAEGRQDVSFPQIEHAVSLVMQRMREQLKKKGWGRFVSTHEAYGVIHEEVLELADTLCENDIQAFRGELMDVAVASIFALAGFLYDGGKEL